jgi:hypothetical protein
VNSTVPLEIMADLEEAARYAASGLRDPEIMRTACERMDKLRDEIHQHAGEVNVAVDLIREGRDEG